MEGSYEKPLYSPAGTWGVERRMAVYERSNDFNNTSTREHFSDVNLKQEKERSKSPLCKFKALRDSKGMVLPYSERAFQSMLSSIPSEDAPEDEKLRFKTTSSSMNDWVSMKSSSTDLTRTHSRLLRLTDSPIALGRSGQRQEKGTNTSGLSGERLNLSADPSRNSFAQRSWLYHEDPALLYKTHGAPLATVPDGLSLPIGETAHNNVASGWVHGRRAILTGDIISKSGDAKAGIYLDYRNYRV